MTAKKPWFEEWFNSPYYHLLYLNRNSDEAKNFIEKLLAHLQPPKDSLLLDFACGKGRHSKILASKGFDVTGIDLATESIKEAKKFENDHLHFFVHDMRMPFWINYFNYAFNFFTSFGYFHTKREDNNSLRTVAQSLQPNGIFVIDYLNAPYAENHLMHQSQIKTNGVNFIITKWCDENHFFKKIIVEDSILNKQVEFCEVVSKFSLNDFTKMLLQQGLEVKYVFGDYDLNKYDDKNSPRMIIISGKTKAQ